MAITGVTDYTSTYAGYANSAKQTTGETGVAKETAAGKTESEVKAGALTNNKGKVQEYYDRLCKKFPQIKINTSGGITSSSKNNIVLNLSNDCLKKMASDPDFAKKIENNIAGIPAAHAQMYAKAKSDGIEIQGFAVRINADGSMQCSCSGSTRTSGTKQNLTTLNAEKKQKERLEKKRKERKILVEKAAKKQTDKRTEEKELMEKLTEDRAAETFTVSVAGTDVKSVTQTLIAAVSGTSVPTGASFDVKA